MHYYLRVEISRTIQVKQDGGLGEMEKEEKKIKKQELGRLTD